MRKRVAVETAAEAYLELLAARGVEYFFGNAGTDFAPIIEAYARRAAQGQVLPRPITVPHEIPAIAMAHGYAMVTGRPQVVMVHVTVGTANVAGGVINAARSHTPILVTAGRTPLTEGGRPGARNRHIHWAQEAFDQAGMVREYVKWDYELRLGAQLETVVDRALALAVSAPAGPVYLTLPREVLAERMTEIEYFEPPRLQPPAARVADPTAVAEAARRLAAARQPLAIVKSSGRDPGAVAPLVALAEAAAMPVFEHYSTHLCFPQSHPLYAGDDPTPYLGEADLILVIDADVPWFPDLAGPRPETPVIQIGEDPLFSRYPIRGFAADLALAGAPRLTLAALAEAVRGAGLDAPLVAERRRRWEEASRRRREAAAERARRAACDAFGRWSRTPPAERAQVLSLLFLIEADLARLVRLAQPGPDSSVLGLEVLPVATLEQRALFLDHASLIRQVLEAERAGRLPLLPVGAAWPLRRADQRPDPDPPSAGGTPERRQP